MRFAQDALLVNTFKDYLYVLTNVPQDGSEMTFSDGVLNVHVSVRNVQETNTHVLNVKETPMKKMANVLLIARFNQLLSLKTTKDTTINSQLHMKELELWLAQDLTLSET